MSLDRFYRDIAPVLLGQTRPDKAAGKFKMRSPDAERLAIYARFCKRHRFEVIEGVFPFCWKVLERDFGVHVWEKLVEDYFRGHPMRHVEINANGLDWPDFLARETASRALHPWLAPLADLEWWDWEMTAMREESPASDPDAGPLRFAPVIEIRPYAYDLVEWIDGEQEGAPARESTFVLFWRDRELAPRRENLDPEEMLVLQSIAAGIQLPAGSAEIVEDLRAAGALHGR